MQVNRKELKAALDIVKPAVSTTGDIVALKHIWWDGDHVYAYNAAMGIRVAYELDLPPGGVLASVFMGVLESSSAEQVDLTVDGSTLTCKVGRSSTKMPLLPESDDPWGYPQPGTRGHPAALKTGQLTIAMDDPFAEALNRARLVKAANPTRSEHYGVVLFPVKDGLALYSTDSKTLVEVQVDGRYSREYAKLVLPHAFIQQLLRLERPVNIQFYAECIAAESGGRMVCSNLLDTDHVFDLPKLANELAGHGEATFAKLPPGLGEALNRASALVGSKENTPHIKLSASPKNKDLILTGKFTNGSIEERFPLAGKFLSAKIAVELESLKALSRDAAAFHIGENALLLINDKEDLYIIASHDEG